MTLMVLSSDFTPVTSSNVQGIGAVVATVQLPTHGCICVIVVSGNGVELEAVFVGRRLEADALDGCAEDGTLFVL